MYDETRFNYKLGKKPLHIKIKTSDVITQFLCCNDQISISKKTALLKEGEKQDMKYSVRILKTRSFFSK